MAKIVRKNMKIFGSSAGANDLGKFGSLASGLAQYTQDPEAIQSLSNYLVGWFGAVLGNNSPCIEDMNALCYLYAYQLAYLMQQGVAEWNIDTNYFTGSVVSDGYGRLYVSRSDNNQGNYLIDYTKWKSIRVGDTGYLDQNYSVLQTDTHKCFIVNSNSQLTATLPDVTATYSGTQYTFTSVNYPLTIAPFGTNKINGQNSPVTLYAYESITIYNMGFGGLENGWVII